MTYFKAYKNIPFVDSKGLGFHFQRIDNRFWVELPFIGITFKLTNKLREFKSSLLKEY